MGYRFSHTHSQCWIGSLCVWSATRTKLGFYLPPEPFQASLVPCQRHFRRRARTGQGIEPDLWPNLGYSKKCSRRLASSGPRVEFEADDVLAAGPATAARDARVERLIVCTPGQGPGPMPATALESSSLNRRRRVTLDEAAIVGKFGVSPASIPDYLALVGDAVNGYPGLPGWGASATTPDYFL